MEWFNRSGVGSVSDLQDNDFRKTFNELEKWQKDFLSESPKFLSKDYIWPKDPFHTWSRVWEYPFIYSNIISIYNNNKNNTALNIVDVGSGVTFFPFALAASGMDIYCTDFDPIIERDLQLAIKTFNHQSGKISFKKTDGVTLPFEDNSIDIIYCISVLEHIPIFENTVLEMQRILKPDGKLFLTIDLDLRGDHDIGIQRYYELKKELGKYFNFYKIEKTIHPKDILTSLNSPYGYKVYKGLSYFKYLVHNYIIRPCKKLKPEPMIPYLLAVEGSSFVKKVKIE
jgi:2-polyprenyl-3-methyl-5-hydroxy-6-metoxy-1,4-benzoquinol methylase